MSMVSFISNGSSQQQIFTGNTTCMFTWAECCVIQMRFLNGRSKDLNSRNLTIQIRGRSKQIQTTLMFKSISVHLVYTFIFICTLLCPKVNFSANAGLLHLRPIRMFIALKSKDINISFK